MRKNRCWCFCGFFLTNARLLRLGFFLIRWSRLYIMCGRKLAAPCNKIFKCDFLLGIPSLRGYYRKIFHNNDWSQNFSKISFELRNYFSRSKIFLKFFSCSKNWTTFLDLKINIKKISKYKKNVGNIFGDKKNSNIKKTSNQRSTLKALIEL